MMVFVAYDIRDTPTRTAFTRRLQHYGLHRIQKSIFCGYLDVDERLDLATEFDAYLSSDKDSIILIPACESCVASILTDGQLKVPEEVEYAFL